MNGKSASGSAKGGNQFMAGYPREDNRNGVEEIPGILRDPVVARARKMNTDIPHILPHEKVFPIQIGSDLFRLSGASISSDAPSYFSEYFKCQLRQAEENGDNSQSIRTLYIDRDPVTFKDISLHLQGYHVAPRDAYHFVKLFADAQFYSLPRLISQLYEESIFITIGHRDFQIPRELFSDPGNSPNYFSLGFAVFFSTPTEIFPGLSREGLLRPPSIMPPSVPNRSADTFAELLHLLRGYPVHIRSEDHRAELLRDCRYFLFKGLEQKLIRHEISYNLVRRRSEITLRLEDVRPSGISVVSFPSVSSSSSPSPESGPATPVYNAHQVSLAYVNYARPFVDSQSYELVLEIGEECTRLHLSTMQCEFVGDGKARIARLFEVISTKLNLPTSQPLGLFMKHGGASSQPASPGNTPISNDWVRCVVGEEAYVLLDGKEYRGHVHGGLGAYATELDLGGAGGGGGRGGRSGSTASSVSGITEENFGEPSRKKRRLEKEQSWVVRTGQWRLKIQGSALLKGGVECLLIAVRLDAVTGEFGRNAKRGFLGT